MNWLVVLTVVCLALQGTAGRREFQERKSPSGRRGSAKTIADAARSDKDAGIDKAKQLLGKGSVADAIPLLRGIVDKDPQNADAYLLLGTALALVPQRAEALDAINQAIRLRPDSAAGYSTLGMVFGRFMEPEAAREAFEKAIELDPQQVETRIHLSLVLAQRKEFVAASQQLQRAIAIIGDGPAASYPQFLLGKIHNEQNMPAEAAKDFEKAIELRPNYAEAYIDLGLTRRRLLDFAGALKVFEKAAILDSKNPTANYRLGVEYLQAGDPAHAVPHLQKAARILSEDRAVLYNLARALRSSGQADAARQIEQKLQQLLRLEAKVRTNTLEATRLNNEGVELEKTGRLTAALEKYQAALDLDPLNGGFRRNLGLCLCRSNEWDRGIAELREVLRQNPNDEETARALYIALDKASRAKAAVGPKR
jgi:tetratricopeptide (TPR) repeat protein